MDADEVFQAIYEQILEGQLKPGSKLHIVNLAKSLGVGASPVREALSRLTATNLVIAKKQRGFIVAPLSHEDMRDIYTTRMYVEQLGLVLSIEKGDALWEAEVAASFHRLAQIEKNTSIDTIERYKIWEKCHREFKVALSAACGLKYLISIQANLYQLAERYRRIWFTTGLKMNRPIQISINKQKAIMEVALARDAQKATEIIKLHFENAIKTIEKSIDFLEN